VFIDLYFYGVEVTYGIGDHIQVGFIGSSFGGEVGGEDKVVVVGNSC
jgi:hypothetical protein